MSAHDTVSSRPSTASAQAGSGSNRGLGSVIFAAVMLMIGGVLNVVYGIAAISDSKFFANDTKYVFSSLHTWGWVTLLLGVLGIVAALSVSRGNLFGRMVGIGVASLMAIGALLSIGGAVPFWSLGVFAVSLIVIHGLAVYDPDPA